MTWRAEVAYDPCPFLSLARRLLEFKVSAVVDLYELKLAEPGFREAGVLPSQL